MECDVCGSTDLYAEVACFQGYVWDTEYNKWMWSGTHDAGERATIYCNNCENSWEEWLLDKEEAA